MIRYLVKPQGQILQSFKTRSAVLHHLIMHEHFCPCYNLDDTLVIAIDDDNILYRQEYIYKNKQLYERNSL